MKTITEIVGNFAVSYAKIKLFNMCINDNDFAFSYVQRFHLCNCPVGWKQQKTESNSTDGAKAYRNV